MPQTDRIRYFAYGANMCSDVFVRRRRIQTFSSEVARLDGYRLVFTEPGIPILEPVFASIEADRQSCVYGVLYELPASAIAVLDSFEGNGYKRFELEVIGLQTGVITAWVYRSRQDKRGLLPSRRYLQLMVKAACEQGFPQEYIDAISAHPSVHIPLLSSLVPRAVDTLERAQQRSPWVAKATQVFWSLLEK